MKRLVLLLAALVVSASRTSAQPLGAGTLADLARPRPGKLLHFSSNDPSGGNGDMRRVEPGKTHTLVDYQGGAGAVRRWWITLAPRNNVFIQRQAIIRCYWDGETAPSVECPVSDFFGLGFGAWKDFQSAPLNMTSGGYNCYWPMPFQKSARITIENRAKVAIDALYYNLAVETFPTPPKDALYFHAQFRRATTERRKPVTLLEATGRGHYVGTVLSMQFLRSRQLGFLEGDEQVYIDGETTASILGTGTEDYFSSGWYFDTGAYSALYHGSPIKETETGRISAYRFHIEDPIPFTKSLKFDIEHGGANDAPPADYCSVAIWYQTHPHAPFPPLPANLLPIEGIQTPKIPGLIEGESLLGAAKATEGAVEAQDMSPFEGNWSGLMHLWWRPTKIGAKLTLSLPAPESREYELIGHFTTAPDYGDIRLTVNGAILPAIVRGFTSGVRPTGPLSLGKVHLQSGRNEVILEMIGKDDKATGFLVGIDGFALK